MGFDFLTHWRPIHATTAWDVDFDSTFAFEDFERVLWQESAIPLGSTIAAVGTAFGGEVAGGGVGVIRDRFHKLIVEINRCGAGKSHAAFEEGVLKSHHTKSDRTVAEVRALGGFGRVEIDIDDVVERTDGDLNGLAEHLMVERAIGFHVAVENHGAQVADGGFIVACIECDLGAEVRRVDDADVILRAAEVAGVFECDPRMSCFEEHFQHLFPDFDGRNLAALDFAFFGEAFVVEVAFLEFAAVGFVQILNFVRAEECPVFAGLHALHEKVRHPVRGVEIMRAAAIVAGVAAQLEEILDVIVPGLEVGTA